MRLKGQADEDNAIATILLLFVALCVSNLLHSPWPMLPESLPNKSETDFRKERAGLVNGRRQLHDWPEHVEGDIGASRG